MTKNEITNDAFQFQSIEDRLQSATLSSAYRAHHYVSAGLDVLRKHIASPEKTDAWRTNASWIIDMLSYSAMDGNHIQYSFGDINKTEKDHKNEALSTHAITAKKALFSNPSPFAAAETFKENLPNLLEACRNTANSLLESIDNEVLRQSEKSQHMLAVSEKPTVKQK